MFPLLVDYTCIYMTYQRLRYIHVWEVACPFNFKLSFQQISTAKPASRNTVKRVFFVFFVCFLLLLFLFVFVFVCLFVCCFYVAVVVSVFMMTLLMVVAVVVGVVCVDGWVGGGGGGRFV